MALTESRKVNKMNTLNKVITWNPLREMEQATQNRFNPFFLGGFPNRMGSDEIHSLAVADWSPEVDISEDDRGYLLKADLPEMKKDDVRVTVEDGILSVSGERKIEKEDQKKKFHRIERSFGNFPTQLHAARRCRQYESHGGVPRRSAESAPPDNADSKIKSYRS